ncbi:hypothetical protein TrLO_g1431 [Triparma laevis f. longispina]|uniref:Dynein heavy chain coiled coil stalk domain-containing protein n=1 Tax=Triparma laevis f. longispina TaxID=1714387 RepID=A0A9W7FNP7_9STRA|nr:hypothetical protein TrLO_g1431 [Triparma laevis f. longispina]
MNAIPAVEKAMAALDTILYSELQSCKGFSKPPPGVDDVFGAVMVLFANVKALPTAKGLKVQKNGQIKEDDRGWLGCSQEGASTVGAVTQDIYTTMDAKSVREQEGVDILQAETADGWNTLEGDADVDQEHVHSRG